MLEIMGRVKYNETIKKMFYWEATQVDYDVVIVGAGASGLIAAITAARQGSSVLVIEQKDKAGKKILATGNGKCNFTNLVQSQECYRSDDSAFAMKVLSCFDVQDTIRFFEKLGIYTKEKNGYLYPNSEQSASVVQVLLMECKRRKVSFVYHTSVTMIRKPNYTIITTGATYYGKRLILATGGCASPKLGSDGSGYTIAKSFGHTIIKPLPALVQLKSNEKYCKIISGVRTIATVTVYAENHIIAKEAGEILYTDYGISGIPIMQVSRFVAKAIDQNQRVYVTMDHLPNRTRNELFIHIKERVHQNPHKTIEETMVGLFNHKLSYIMMKQAHIDPTKKSPNISKDEIEALVEQMKEFRMTISETNTFDHAQVSAGGVSTEEIDENTMESKLSKNLFLTGELVDVDGTCGGYNLQWAWSSGYLAGITAGN